MEQSSAATIFLEQWLAKCGTKKNDTAMSLAMYNSNVAELQASVAPTDKLTSRQQNLRRYFFLVPGIDREIKLVKKSRYEDGKFLYVVPNELLYETIMREHIATGHGGITKMKEYTKYRYSNVTQEAITLCLSLCNICEQKRKKKGSKSLVIRPIRSNEVHERMQADLIDMQHDPDGAYRYILTAQDHFTKMVHLRPIKQKTKEEVSDALLEIFLTTNGAPRFSKPIMAENSHSSTNAFSRWKSCGLPCALFMVGLDTLRLKAVLNVQMLKLPSCCGCGEQRMVVGVLAGHLD